MMIPYTPHAAAFSVRVSARAGLRSGWAEADPAGNVSGDRGQLRVSS